MLIGHVREKEGVDGQSLTGVVGTPQGEQLLFSLTLPELVVHCVCVCVYVCVHVCACVYVCMYVCKEREYLKLHSDQFL